jgi:Transposase
MQLVRPAQEDGSMSEFNAYVGLYVYKDSISVAIAEAGRDGEVRQWGVVRNTPEAMVELARRWVERHQTVEFAYEAGPCGYTLYRHLTASGLTCRVIAPSRTPRKPGDRIKNDTRDAVTLARLVRAGELTFVWVPDQIHEAMRDRVRARQTAANDVRQARAHIQMFLLKHGIRYLGNPWGSGIVFGSRTGSSRIPRSSLPCRATSIVSTRRRVGPATPPRRVDKRLHDKSNASASRVLGRTARLRTPTHGVIGWLKAFALRSLADA